MDSFYGIDNTNLARLSPELAVRYFHDLLCAEATANGIPTTAVSVPFEIDTPDGGIDAEVTGASGTIGQGIIREGLTRYQIKTGGFSQKATLTDAQEILLSKATKKLKPKVKSCLDKNGTLSVVLFGDDNPEPKDSAAKKKLIEVLEKHDAKYKYAKIEILRPNQLVGFLSHIPLYA